MGALGLGIAAWSYKIDPQRFAFSYLFAFFVSLSLPLGSLFFVLVQYITKSSWSVTVRRVAELLMRPMPIFAVLVIPLVLTIGQLFPWLGAKHPAAEADASSETENVVGGVARRRGPRAGRDARPAGRQRKEDGSRFGARRRRHHDPQAART